jgi:hypothetical protein
MNYSIQVINTLSTVLVSTQGIITEKSVPGPQGDIGYVGSRGNPGVSVNIKGEVATVQDLPAQASQGDAYIVIADGNLYTWTGDGWLDVGQIVGPQGEQGSTGYTGSTGSKGDQGDIGYVGSQGIQGDRGDLGYTGSTGSKGDIGYTGSRGIDGNLGSTGYVGSTGDKGDIGYTGSAGPKGDSGDSGTQGGIGYTGSAGPKGDQGIQGDRGDLGYTGSLGFTGSQGIQGDRGDTGFTGSTGSKGDKGDIGYVGSQGDQGIQGDIGYTGSTGDKGDIGYVGSQGIQGDIGYVGSQGIQGDMGYTGSTGDKGDIGYTGSTGDKGDIGYVGSQGIQGDFGYTGSVGPKGDAGGYTGSMGATGYTGSAAYGALNTQQIISSTSTVSAGGSFPATVGSVSITTNGNPISVVATGDIIGTGNIPTGYMQLYRDSTPIGTEIRFSGSSSSSAIPYTINFTDTPVAGTYTYTLRATRSTNARFGNTDGPTLIATELSNVIGYTGSAGANGNDGADGAPGGLGATELFARNSLPTGVAGQVITISNSGSDTNAPAGNYALAYWDADTSEWIYVGNSNSVTPIDDIAPTISISSDQTSLGANETATITFYLSEASQNFGSSAIDVIGGSIGSTDKSGNTYTATFTPNANSSGTASIKVPAGRFNDIAGNPNASDSNTIEISYDTVVSLTAPVITKIVDSNYQSIPNNGSSSEPTFVQIQGTSTMPMNTNIKIYSNGTLAGSTSLDALGNWQFNDYGFGAASPGDVVYTARVEVAGVESTDSNSYTITKT